jgi:protein disulfide-isomerase
MGLAMIRRALYLSLLLFWSWSVAAGEVSWLTDLGQGRRQAREQGKDLLILFTGTAWCGFCTQLDYEVLDRADFARIANALVLVKLEFPAANELLPPATKEEYIAWRNEFGIVGFPTLFLADFTGRPYAVTGCTGEPVKEYVDRLEALRANRDKRDEALGQAQHAQGLDAARCLDRALDAVVSGIDDDYRTPDGSYLAWFYRAEIDRILAADADDALGLRTKYRALLDNKQQKRIQALLDQLAATRRERGEEAAIELINTELARADSEPVAAQLRVSLVSYLESAQRYPEALETVLRFAALPQTEPNQRRVLKGQAASLLQELGRDEEALLMYEEAIHEVG